MNDLQMARALGWASIGLGLAEIAAPDWLQKQLGLAAEGDYRGVLRVLGIREVMQGVGILSEDRITPKLTAGVWTRVAGDVLDLALLGAAARKSRRPMNVGIATAMVIGISVLDAVCAQRLQQQEPVGRLQEGSIPRRLREALPKRQTNY